MLCVHRQSLLSEAQQSQVLDALVSRLASAQHSHTKLALLSTLEGLGVGTDSILLAILPSLVDPNVSCITCMYMYVALLLEFIDGSVFNLM